MPIVRFESVAKITDRIFFKDTETVSPDLLDGLFVSQNQNLHWSDIVYAYRCVGMTGKNIFQLTGRKENETNALELLTNFYRISISAWIPSAYGKKAPELSEMQNWEGVGLGFNQTQLNELLSSAAAPDLYDVRDPHSLPRHLVRTTYLAGVMTRNALTHQQINFEDITKTREFGDRKLGGLHPFHIGIPSALHDAARVITQTSNHDVLSEKLVSKLLLPKSFGTALHSPVPTEPLKDAAKYDVNGAQRILRLADVFGKMIAGPRGKLRLRTSLEEALAHSRERQLHYFTTERKTKGSFWYRKSVDHLEAYLENERLVLSAARDWYKDEAGQSFTELLEQINTEPDVLDVYRTEIFEPERYRIL